MSSFGMTITGVKEIEKKLLRLEKKDAKKIVKKEAREAQKKVMLPAVKSNATAMIGGVMGTLIAKQLTVRVMTKMKRGSYGAKVIIKDSDGNVVNNLFAYKVKSLVGLESIEGNDAISINEQGKIDWVIIPEDTAGGMNIEGQMYYVGAKLFFAVNGRSYEYETEYEPIIVKPQPSLIIEYHIP